MAHTHVFKNVSSSSKSSKCFSGSDQSANSETSTDTTDFNHSGEDHVYYNSTDLSA